MNNVIQPQQAKSYEPLNIFRVPLSAQFRSGLEIPIEPVDCLKGHVKK
jgi:hypothetical protein